MTAMSKFFPSACLLVSIAFTGCAEPEATPRPNPSRVRIEFDPGPADPANGARREGAWARHGKGEPETAVLSDLRDAWVLSAGRTIDLPLEARGRFRVESAAAVVGDVDAVVADAMVEFRLVLRRDGHVEVLARESISLREARHTWTALVGDFRYELRDEATLRFEASFPADITLDWAVEVPSGLTPGPRRDLARPNLLLISVDTLRADHLGCYGYARDTSPRIDALAARGVLFEELLSTAPWTLPSYGTLFTGLEPTRHRAGVERRLEERFGSGEDLEREQVQDLAPSAATLAQILAREGYRTLGLVSNPYLDARSGVDRGFGRWLHYVNRAQSAVELADRHLTGPSDAPWFLFVHMIDPHAPYTPLAPWDRKFSGRSLAELPNYPPSLKQLRAQAPDAELQRLLVDLYDGEIAYTDEQVGRLLDLVAARGELENTLVIFHSDHGEEFWEHGGFEHGHALTREVLHVPWIAAGPGLPVGQRVPRRLSSVDVMPTILDWLHVDAPPSLDGRSVAALARGEPLIARDVLSESVLYGPREFKALMRGQWKLVSDGASSRTLIDLSVDRDERVDLAGAQAQRANEMNEDLRARARRNQNFAAAAGQLSLSEAERRALESLGYFGGGEKR